MDIDELRVVLVHDWLTGMRGGEKVLDVFCRRWPSARLFTLLHRRGALSPAIEAIEPTTSILQKFPGVQRYYRYLLPLMPWAARWRLPEADLVLSTSHCVAKSARPPEGTPHISYCFTPMRYAWHMKEAYFGRSRGLKAWLREKLLHRIRAWDRQTAQHVTHFVAISRAIQQRIRDAYQRDSVVIYPPVDTHFFTPAPVAREDYYLALSAFAPYKRFDLALAACNQLQRKLVVIGTGQDEKKLKRLAGPTIHFLGWQSDEAIRDHLRRCRAVLFPAEEDFGIVPVEANACGAPVIAFGRGGATETIVPLDQGVPPTGVWFNEQTTESLVEAMLLFEKRQRDFDPRSLRRRAQRFNSRRFEEEMFGYIQQVLGNQQPLRLAA